MLRTFAAALVIACAFSGAADARMAGGAGVSSAHHKYHHHYVMRCAEGMVRTTCSCHSAASGHAQLCHAGHWCHAYEGICRQ